VSRSPVFDAAVIGAGPAGAVAAYVLARLGRSVALVEARTRPPVRKIGESLPGAARPLLGALGLLHVVERGRHGRAVGNVSAWGSSELETADALRDPHGSGWHLRRAAFDADLRQAALAAGGESRIGRVGRVERAGDVWRLRLGDDVLQTRWLVDATGRGATVARRVGAVRVRDDELTAVYAWARPRRGDRDRRVLVEARPGGWWYTSLLPDGARVVAYHTLRAAAEALGGDAAAFASELAATEHVREVVREDGLLGAPRCTEACGARLDRFGGDAWLAAGDAAMAFDPLSSQGIYNSLYCGMKAGQTVHAALAGDGSAVARYADRLEQIRAHYVARRQAVYATEPRWWREPFWEAARRTAPLEIRR
jgi:flavin-dependent dehydrogenase